MHHSGRIGRSSVTQGALVSANQQAPLAIIQQLDPIYVDLTQSSAEWLALQKAVEAGRLRRDSDLPVTILEFFGIDKPPQMVGRSIFKI